MTNGRTYYTTGTILCIIAATFLGSVLHIRNWLFLAKRYRVITLDFLGCGQSDRNLAFQSLHNFGIDIDTGE